MCFSSSPSPPPPPPVVEATPPPPAPKRADPEVRQAKRSSQRVAARAVGRPGTILGGALIGQAPGNQPRKTLLGA